MQTLIDHFSTLTPTVQALYATLFTWGVTALGAALVFFFKRVNQKVLDAMLGVEELIPEAHRGGNEDLVSLSVIGGFSIMMVLDVALG